MKGTYRQVAHWQRLLPQEREVLTGRPAGHRDDKGRHEPPRSRTFAGKGVLVVGTVVLLLTVGGLIARAVIAAGERGAPAPTQAAPPSSAAASTTAAPPRTEVPPVPTDAAATAILLQYRGGRSVVHECSDVTGAGGCSYLDTKGLDPLVVRCTAKGCTLLPLIDNRGGPLTGPLRISGRTRGLTDGCQETRWSLQLNPVGQAVTEGVRHPARLVGQVTQERPAELRATVNCLGAREVYRYDATPS